MPKMTLSPKFQKFHLPYPDLGSIVNIFTMSIIFFFFFFFFIFRQEGVKKGIYKPIYVQVKDNFNNLYQCRTYQLIDQNIGLPSPQYKDIMIRGARQHQLPSEYIKTLTAMCDNGSTEEIPIYNELMEIIGEKTSS